MICFWELLIHLLVPIIAVFTKFDQFKFIVEMGLEDDGYEDPTQDLIDNTAQKQFDKTYSVIQCRPSYVILDGRTAAIGVHCSNNIARNA